MAYTHRARRLTGEGFRNPERGPKRCCGQRDPELGWLRAACIGLVVMISHFAGAVALSGQSVRDDYRASETPVVDGSISVHPPASITALASARVLPGSLSLRMRRAVESARQAPMVPFPSGAVPDPDFNLEIRGEGRRRILILSVLSH